MFQSKSLADGVEEIGFDELRRDLRDDGVTIAAQSSHSVGNPINQRECAGFNWPPLSIPASEPVRS
jgi:hypothetical protein